MFKGKDKLTIVLTPDHLTMARVRRGKVIQAERVDLDASKWDDSWCGGLHQFDQPLRQILARFGGTGKQWAADLFYASPGSICRVDLSEQDQPTASLNMTNGLRQTVGRANRADATSLYSDDQNTLTLGVTDTEANLQKVFAWLNRSKVSVLKIIPSNASIVRQAMLKSQIAPDDTVTLYLSGRSSVIGYFQDGHPKLVRLIEIGFDSLADVYRRAMEEQASEHESDESGSMAPSQSVCGCDTTATEMLFKHGIPVGQGRRDEQIAKLMPALAPILQRISIEVKQTLRFASSLDTTPSNLRICGPGAAIPHIGVALGQSLDLHVDSDPNALDYEPTELFGTGTDELAFACDFDLDLELLPKAALEIRTRRGLDMGVRAGGIVAAVFLGGQFLYATQQSGTVESVIAQQAYVIERIENDRDRRQSISSIANSIGAAATLINDSMGNQVDWFGLLGAMPDDDRELIQISEIQGLMNANHPMLNLSGTAMADSTGSDASQVLSRYIKSLKANKLVKRIEIGSTSRTRVDESTWGLNFVLSIEMTTEQGQFSELTKLSMGSGG